MAFPATTKYFLRFRHSDTGLTPVFSFCKRADTMVDVVPPSVVEVANGTYYFSWTFATPTDPAIVFEVDGGASIPTEEVRYIGDTISPSGFYLDEPISQVATDVWNDNTARAAGTKGHRVDGIGDPVGASISADLQSDTSAIEASIASIGGVVGGLPAPDNAGIAAIKAKTDLLPNNVGDLFSTISAQLLRVLGMLHENSVLDKVQYDPATNNLISARFRLYANATDAQAARNAGDLADDELRIAQYSIVSQYSGDNMLNYLVVKEYPTDELPS